MVLGGLATSASASYTATFNGGTGPLTVTGDDATDQVVISRNAAGSILVDVNGSPLTISSNAGAPTVANVTTIVVTTAGGDDTVTINEASGALPAATMTGGSGNNTLTGGSGADSLSGGGGNDTILGKGSGDTLNGGPGSDTLTGGDADDSVLGGDDDDSIIWNPGDDTDTVDGGAGNDTATINGGNGAETFDVSAQPGKVVLARTVPAPFTVTTSAVENGVIHANGGDDTILGHAGLAGVISLLFDGGTGKDTMTGGDGNDRFIWALSNITDNDTIDGGAGDDTLSVDGDDSSETFTLFAGATSTLVQRNGAGANALSGLERLSFALGDGNDTITAPEAVTAALDVDGGAGNDNEVGGAGNDRLVGGPGSDTLRGGSGNDSLFGDADVDLLDGGPGADDVHCAGLGDALVTDADDIVDADCKPPVEAGGGDGGGGGGTGGGGGGGGTTLPTGFLGFAKPAVKVTLDSIVATVKNTHTAAITVKVSATESGSTFRAVTKTIQPGKKVAINLATPRKLRAALARKLAKTGKVVLKPRVTVANTATSGKTVLKPKVTLKKKKPHRR